MTAATDQNTITQYKNNFQLFPTNEASEEIRNVSDSFLSCLAGRGLITDKGNGQTAC